METKNNILIVKNRALGDSIMGLSSVQYLRTLYPQANIVYAVPQWVAPLYDLTKTSANQIYPLSLKSVRDFFDTYYAFRKLKIDYIHELHQSGRGAKAFRLIAFLLGIPYTTHNHHIKSKTKVLDQGVSKPLIQRDLDGVYSFLGSREVPNYLNFSPRLEVAGKSHCQQRVIFGVVATRSTKMWPLENFINLAKLIQQTYPQFKVAIPLSSSLQDQSIKSQLLEYDLPTNIEIVEMALSQLPSYFKESSFYIGNDTGLKHLAVAVGLKTFTMFGPEPVLEWHPYNEENHKYFYIEGLDCRTRKSHYCGLAICDLREDNMQCLKLLSVEKIFNLIAPTCKDFLHSHDL